VERDAAGQRLRRLAEEPGRRAPEHEESGRQRPTIREHPETLKQFGHALHLVDHDEPAQRLERRERRGGEPTRVARVLEVEERRTPPPPTGDLARERRLADLTRAEKRDDGTAVEQRLDPADMAKPRNHPGSIP
jgi:hypothetical protein